jgi:hypothetical protein
LLRRRGNPFRQTDWRGNAAFPDCFTLLGGKYINSAATGAWEDFLLQEMLRRSPIGDDALLKFGVVKLTEIRQHFGEGSGLCAVGLDAMLVGQQEKKPHETDACAAHYGFDERAFAR